MSSAPYQPHSASSKAAAQRVAPYLRSIRYKIYNYISANPGVTDDEIRDHLGLNNNTARPRRIELERRGLVEWTGNIRIGHLGATALTWQVTDVPYPIRWNEQPQVEQTESGEARIRRALGRAFPAARPSVQALLERLIAKLTATNGIANSGIATEVKALKKVLRPTEFERMLLLIIS